VPKTAVSVPNGFGKKTAVSVSVLKTAATPVKIAKMQISDVCISRKRLEM